MVENLSEASVNCSFHFLNRYGFKLAEKNWYFGKYKISLLAFFISCLLVIKCWLTYIYKEHKEDGLILTNSLFELNAAIAGSMYLMKLIVFMWKSNSIYNLIELLKIDKIVFDNLDKRLEKDQKFCIKIARIVTR